MNAPITTAEQAIQELGDSIAGIFEQMLKGNWRDDHGHDVRQNIAMVRSTETMARVMQFRTDFLGMPDVSGVLAGGEAVEHPPVVPATTDPLAPNLAGEPIDPDRWEQH